MTVNVKANGTTHALREEFQYSTSASVYTGRKWIDGKKIYTTVISTSTQSEFYTLPSCCKGLISTLINIRGMAKQSNGNWFLLPTAHKDNVRDGIGLFVVDSNSTLYVTWNGNDSFAGGGIPLYSRVYQNQRITEGWC